MATLFGLEIGSSRNVVRVNGCLFGGRGGVFITPLNPLHFEIPGGCKVRESRVGGGFITWGGVSESTVNLFDAQKKLRPAMGSCEGILFSGSF